MREEIEQYTQSSLRRWKAGRRKLIRKMLRENVSRQDIAQQLGVSAEYVRRLALDER